MTISLSHALRTSNVQSIAFIGAGGKTTAMFQLARQLHQPVIVTTTTHLGAWQVELADKHVVAESPTLLKELDKNLNNVFLVTGKLNGDRYEPVHPDVMNELYQYCKQYSISLLIEADGSRQKSLKAWAEHEPPIPYFVEQVVHVAGLSGLGKPLTEENVHRPEIFSALSGLNTGEAISPDRLVKVLSHSEGGLKNMPPNARKVLLLNQANTPELQSTAHGMSHTLLSSFDSVVVSSLKEEKIFAVHEPVAGIILAAGKSSRFGEPKQLLDWKGEPFVRVVAKTALNAGLSPVIVVTGSNAEQIEAALNGLDITIVRNDDWESGQGSSIRKGILSLTPTLASTSLTLRSARQREMVGAAIFLLADQPQVGTSIIHALQEKHAKGLYSIVAPMVIDRRANPILFDHVTFPDLLALEGDVGGRQIFHKYRVEYLPWHDDGLLLDVDTPEHYQRLISNDDL